MSSSSRKERPSLVEAGDTQAVSGPGVVEELGEPGALGAFSRGDIGEDAPWRRPRAGGRAGRIGVLLAGGHAGVAQRVAEAGWRRTYQYRPFPGRLREACRGCRSAELKRLFNGP